MTRPKDGIEMQRINDRLISWATDIDDATIRQAERTARLPIVYDHVALMPDAHLGLGATVGSVIPTMDSVIPSAVGVDIGCGMIASRLDAKASDLPDDLARLLPQIERAVPAGVGKGHDKVASSARSWLDDHRPASELTPKQAKTAAVQFGTLGSGNHFCEFSLDEDDYVWVVLHSGSRGIGNQLANFHIDKAKRLANDLELGLEDPDLAYFVQGTPEFEMYIADMLWAQEYAMANRQQMMAAAVAVVLGALPEGVRVIDTINCHHNFTTSELHGGIRLWVTRKGAIRAHDGDRGVIPGSMGTSSYIVEGLGQPDSWMSCAHGAGRRMSRSKARRTFTPADLETAMEGKTWLKSRASSLVDEIPASYKNIDRVMEDQRDLVSITHVLRQVLNYKGT